MNKKGFRKCLLIFFTLCSLYTKGQGFDSTLKKLHLEYRQEKLHLHFDRTVFYPGETLWFKAYLFAGNFPSLVSQVIYADLLDAKGTVLQHKILPVVLSTAAGAMEIPGDYHGTLVVRAYTKWMLNFDSSFLFTKPISVLNPDQQSSLATYQTQGGADLVSVSFFPEGGDLLQGIKSRVAFKAINLKGMPMAVSGDIVNGSGTKITSFESVHDGMGTFWIQPQTNEVYQAVWSYGGKKYQTSLPAAKQEGVLLQVSSRENEIEFTIKRSPVKVPYPFVYVVAQMHGQLLYRGKAAIVKTASVTSAILIKNAPPGIVQLTVFTPTELPIAERIVFVNLASCSNVVDLTTSFTNTGARQKKVIEIEVPDSLDCNFSLSVTDADLPSQQDENIYSNLLLSSDIKGYVHHPAYYFSSYSDSILAHLDLVMMTNGWRRFKWEDVLAGRFPAIKNLPDNYISIEGQVRGANNQLPSGKQINGILEFKDRRKQILNADLQAGGKFRFPALVFFDSAKLYFHLNQGKSGNVAKEIETVNTNLLTRPLLHKFDSVLLSSVRRYDSTQLRTSNLVYQKQQAQMMEGKTKTLKAVVVTTKKKTKQEEVDKEYASGAFADNPNSRIILPEDDPAFLSSESLLKYLEGRVAGLQINPEASANPVIWRGSPTALFVNEISQQAVSFIDGRLVEDASYILSLSMSEIAMVKIFDPPFFGGWNGGAGGAIAVYLRKAGRDNSSLPAAFITVPGFTALKEFYSPDYSAVAPTSAADYRRTLYWNPFVLSDKEHRRISLTFYNNDVTKRMKVILEGCNKDGKLYRLERNLN